MRSNALWCLIIYTFLPDLHTKTETKLQHCTQTTLIILRCFTVNDSKDTLKIKEWSYSRDILVNVCAQNYLFTRLGKKGFGHYAELH